MRVALVHDDLVQWGGAERVLLGITEIFPEAPIYTLAFDDNNPILLEKFKSKKIVTSFINRLPGWRNYFKATLPLQPMAFEQFDFTDFDLVITQTTRFAKSIITKPETLHICYCHTPPRFLWNFSGEKTSKFIKPLLNLLRLFDRVSAERPDLFLAGSENAKKRIEKIYGKKGQVLFPFIELDKYKNVKAFKGEYYLVVARLNQYKRVDLAIDVCQKTGRKLKIVGAGPLLGEFEKISSKQSLSTSKQSLSTSKQSLSTSKQSFSSSKNIEILGRVSEELLLSLLAGCKGLIITAEEDFGLTSLEAQILGKGVIAFGKGGTTETIIDGKTGVFFEEQNVESLKNALERFEKIKIDPGNCQDNAKKFSKEVFQLKLQDIVKQAKDL